MVDIVDVTESDRGKMTVAITVGEHHLIADEPKPLGDDLGPAPHEYLLAGLGACTVMTLRMYANRKQMKLARISVRLTRRKIKATDCPDCYTTEGEVEEMMREVTLEGDITEPERARLLEIANKCPVHRTLTGEIKIRTSLTPA